jgi:hypothetical protein
MEQVEQLGRKKVNKDKINKTMWGILKLGSSSAGSGDLLAANNLSDVANAATSNHNLGNLHGTYTPTFTPKAGTAGTITALHESLYTEVDTEAISGSVIVEVALDEFQTQGTWNFDLPILPNNNFSDQFDLQINVGYPINQVPNPNWIFKVTGESGAKTGRFFFNSDTAGDSVIISFFYAYHNN